MRQLALLNKKHFAKSLERSSGQKELQFVNEAELLHTKEALDDVID